MSEASNITVLVDEWTIPGNDPGFESMPKQPSTEYHVVNALRDLGYSVSIVGASEDTLTLVQKLTEQKPDLVFNLTEQLRGDRRMDKNIASVLEMMGVPFTGTGPMGLLLTRDKRLCKQLLSLHKIRVPDFVFFPPGRAVRVPRRLGYPLVVKPAFEDSSEGISNASVVANEQSLKERVQFVHDGWSQPAIAEEYVAGREMYVSIIGNRRLTVLPIRECLFDFGGSEGPDLATYRVKWNAEYRKKWKIEFGFAELDPLLAKRIGHICKRVYRILEIRDYGRIDLRLTPESKLVVLEANCNPDLAYGEDVAESAEKEGISYEKLIDRIIHLALRRYR